MDIAVFDAKQYDVDSFMKYQGQEGLYFKFYESRLGEDTVSLAEGSVGVCVFVNDSVTKVVIDELCKMKCKFIALRCAGFNNVNVDYARGKIAVFRVPDYSPYAIAEHSMAMLLTLDRKIHRAYIRTRDYNFSLNGLMGFDLYGKTMGVIGTGRIGRAFVRICQGFGMNVIAYDKYPDTTVGVKYTTLEEIFESSDIISLHCPLTEDTFHLIDDQAISRMKDGVIIVNTSRGALINASALLKGILSRKIGGACLDVYEEETDIFYEDRSGHIIDDSILSRLISMPNVIVTSHQAFLTKEALDNISEVTFNNIYKCLSGELSGNELYGMV